MNFPSDAWSLLSPIISAERRERLVNVATNRTEYVRLVLQDLFDPHNVAACMRSAEAFGILNVDVVSTNSKFKKPSTTARGAQHWIHVHKYNTIKACVEHLKNSGYKLAAAYPPRAGVIPLKELPTEEPLAIIFGNEHNGLDAEWNDFIDYKFSIPMHGMVESFNISVSAALALHDITDRARTENSANFLISEETKNSLLNKWVCRGFRDYEKQLEILRRRLH